jgi:hypothetical protein
MRQVQQTYGNRAVQRFLQRKSTSDSTNSEEGLGDQIRSKSGGGSSLDGGVRDTLEQGIGADMGGVRVHTDSQADTMARSVDSVAFTSGQDIFFREGTYNPGSSDGMRLLAHEATHTVQQSQGPVAGTPAPGGVSISHPSDSFEQAAEQSADNVMAGVQAMRTSQAAATTGGVPAQREAAEEEEESMQTMRTDTYVQRQAEEEEEEAPMQAMRSSTYTASVQREAAEEEEEESMQAMRTDTYVQREEEEEEPMQTMRTDTYVQRQAEEEEEM